MVEVAVIGAGAAGLVTARNLLRCGLRARVFESRLFPGGAWSAAGRPVVADASTDVAETSSPIYHPPQMWDNLKPNLSKYTCSFSDHPWRDGTPTFPTLAQMHQYLDDYAHQHLLDQENCTLHYGCTVTNVEQDSDTGYRLQWVEDSSQSSSPQLQSKTFDGVVVATGFFSSPIWPTEELQELAQQQQQQQSSPPRIIHSSQYRSPTQFANQTVAIVGGGFSACEIATDARRHANRVVNILGHTVPYVLPRYVAASEQEGILPLDCVLYRRTADAPSLPETTRLDAATSRQRHEFLRGLVGPRKRAQARIQGFDFPEEAFFETCPPMVSISDDYLDLVIDGKIEVVKSRVAEVSEAGNDDKLELRLEDGSVVSGMDSVIMCTGYRSQLDFLSPAIQKTLQYNASDSFAPLTLCHDTFHPKLPGLGFVGMYRGPYFGVMELQAKLYAGLLSQQINPLPEESVVQALETSKQIREHQPRSQFPHFDYIGFMDTLAEPLNLVPNAKTFGAQGMMVTPAFYQPSDKVAKEIQTQLQNEVEEMQNDHIPRAALSALVGRWNFEREIHDHLSCATQHVHGQVAYSLDDQHDLDSLRYREDGFLDLENGNTLEVFREYDYRCTGNTLELYFVENGERAHLFLSLKFEKHQNGYWHATSDHLCINDLYKGTFEIAFDGLGASEVSMTYRVKGPNKDYEAITRLSPIL